MTPLSWERCVLLAGLWALTGFCPKAFAIEFIATQHAHIVAQPATDLERRVTAQLAGYVSQVLRAPVRIVPELAAVPEGAPAIVLSSGGRDLSPGFLIPGDSPEAFALETRSVDGREIVVAAGRTDRGLKRAVQRLVIRSEQRAPGLVIPALHVAESPWIARREWTLCAWSPELVRGVFSNPQADQRMNVWRYDERQVAAYADMFDWFGFSGAQLMGTVANYATAGSAAAYHDRLSVFIRSLRANAQDVTLWVWAAQFDGFGWVDPSVTYAPSAGRSAFDDPAVRATFEKYYDGYAELAPDVDLLITHFYDPGMLKDRADVFAYMGLLRNKFRSGNPHIRFGVDFWAAEEEGAYMRQLLDQGFKDVLFLENTMPHTYPPGRREALHEAARQHGVELGVWGWHTAEIESDQMPTMHVNARLLAHFYRQMRDGAHRLHPVTYWSEMEACHLVNIFSLYAAGQLLWNPDRDPDELLREIAEGIWGPRHGPAVLAALQLIQDVRTGPTWDTYWWSLPTHRLGTADPAKDLRRAEASIAALAAIGTDANYVPKFPLPFPPATFIELIQPHLWQIRAFADFRVKLAALEADARSGLDRAELTRRANAIWDPIRDYTTWIGVFGPPEAMAQENQLLAFAKSHGITVNPPAWLRWRDANRQLQSLQGRQRALAEPLRVKADAVMLNREFFWSVEKGRDCFQLLIDQGLVVPSGPDTYQLAKWEEFRCR